MGRALSRWRLLAAVVAIVFALGTLLLISVGDSRGGEKAWLPLSLSLSLRLPLYALLARKNALKPKTHAFRHRKGLSCAICQFFVPSCAICVPYVAFCASVSCVAPHPCPAPRLARAHKYTHAHTHTYTHTRTHAPRS
jgi:hypothetical protein